MTRNTTAKANKLKVAGTSPLLKLFNPDSIGPPGNVRSLRHVRDKIYSYAWSRDRRDDHKLDWVVTQWGFNRNVPERYIPDTPYGTAAFQRLHELPCNLHLVNKQISEDFTRFIYTVNDLEIDVDLKAVYSKQGEAGLQKIVSLLQNPNLQKYTQTARIRIHFPNDYPANNLPTFNQRALEDIAWSLDSFQQLSHLAVRVVPAQGALLDYELRVAAFPFYPIRMTYWSIRTLNTTAFPYKWDLLDGQQTRLLDKAWMIYKEVGSLTAPTHPAIKKPQPARGEVGSRNIASDGEFSENQPAKKNGSQKKKYRKKKVMSAALHAGDGSISASNSAVACHPGQSHPGTSSSPQPLAVGATFAKSNLVEPAKHATSISTPKEPQVAITEPFGTGELGSASAMPPSPPPSPTQSETAGDVIARRSPSPKTADSNVLTLTAASEDNEPLADGPDEVNGAADEEANRQDSRPPSPAPSSATLGAANEIRATSEDAREQDGVTGQPADYTQQQKQQRQQKQKKRRNGKKKPKNSKHPEAQADSARVTVPGPCEAVNGQIEDNVDLNSTGSQRAEQAASQAVEVADKSPKLNLSGPNTVFTPLNTSMVYFKDNDTGNSQFISRNPRVNRFIRQQERRRTDQAKRQAEQKEARDKRQSRRAKQLLLRRDNITANSLLSRAMMRRPEDVKKKGAANHLGCGSQNETPLDNEIFVLDENFMRTELAIRQLGSLHHHFNFQLDSLAGHNDIDSIAQGFVESVPESSSLKEDGDSKQNSSRQDEEEIYQHSAEDFPSRARVSSVDDGELSSAEPNDEDQISQPQNDVPSPSHTFTDDEAHDGRAEGQKEDSSTRDARRAGGQSSWRGRRSWRDGGSRRAPAQDARRGCEELRTEASSPAAQDARIENRNKWAAAVQASDEAIRVETRKRRVELERDMKTTGTDYTDYVGPINDKWTRTDEDGKSVEVATEQVVYGNQSQVSAPSAGPISVDGHGFGSSHEDARQATTTPE